VVTFDAQDPVSADFRARIADELEAFLEGARGTLRQVGPELDPVWQLAADAVSGGKRLRPAFCVWGRIAAGGPPADPRPLLRAAASLDLLHASALVHDDVMDASDTRRGRPSAHRALEARHAAEGLQGASDAFGRAGAILLGDLLLIWSDELLRRSGLPAADLERAQPLLEAVRTEVTAGQFLDILAQARPPRDARERPAVAMDRVNRVVDFKTARYTVTRPAQIGAALGGADEHLLEGLARYGALIGRAFQFRDDLLGVFGDASVTGKPAGDDLREGKLTVLVAQAMARADDAGANQLASLLGRGDLSPADVDRARQIIMDSGAYAAAENDIARCLDEAVATLAATPMTTEGRQALTRLAVLSTERDT